VKIGSVFFKDFAFNTNMAFLTECGYYH